MESYFSLVPDAWTTNESLLKPKDAIKQQSTGEDGYDSLKKNLNSRLAIPSA